MFSSRTSWSHEKNELTRLLEEKRRRGEPIIDLTLSNPTVAGFVTDPDRILSPLSRRESLQYDPHPFGLPAAREAIARFYSQQGIFVDTANILLTASTSEAYSYIFRLLCNPGDIILVPAPSYPLFDFLAQLNDVSLRYYRLEYDGEWHIDLDSVRSLITSTTRAIVLLHPNNPTGSFVSVTEREAINKLAASRTLPLIVDEVFHPFAFTQQPPSFVSNEPTLTFTLNGISKLLGLPQMKLAWMTLSGPDHMVAEARARLEVIADTVLSVNTPVQHALPSYFEHLGSRTEEIGTRVRMNYQSACELLRGSAVSVLRCQGGWNAVLRMPSVMDDERWAMGLLGECGILTHPGSFYNFSRGSHLVISLLPPDIQFVHAVEKIRDFAKRQQ